jgi:hypothetical protein
MLVRSVAAALAACDEAEATPPLSARKKLEVPAPAEIAAAEVSATHIPAAVVSAAEIPAAVVAAAVSAEVPAAVVVPAVAVSRVPVAVLVDEDRR